MHEHCTTKMRKCWCMKFLCIISGCPAGARKWHISIAKSAQPLAAAGLSVYCSIRPTQS